MLQHRPCAARFSHGICCTEAPPPPNDSTDVVTDTEREEDGGSPSASPHKMTAMDNIIFLGYIGGFMAFFFAFASALKTLGGQQ
jgi:hypothetical protein